MEGGAGGGGGGAAGASGGTSTTVMALPVSTSGASSTYAFRGLDEFDWLASSI